jgi:drug/metabolite transporter (DMT)-like permease
VAVFGLNVYVLGRWPASAVSFEFLLFPIATVPFSALLTGEAISPLMLLGGGIVLVGVYLGVLAPQGRRFRKRRLPTPEHWQA